MLVKEQPMFLSVLTGRVKESVNFGKHILAMKKAYVTLILDIERKSVKQSFLT
jgi:hypothetical protein